MDAHRRRLRTPDALAVTAVAWLRVGVAIGAAAGGAAPAHLTGRGRALFLVLGLVWVPWTIVVLFASERPSSRLALVGGPVGDILALFAAEVLAPSANVAMLSGYLVVIAFAAYTVGRGFAGFLAAVSICLAALAQALVPDTAQVAPSVLVSFSVAALAIVFLLDRTSSLQSRTSARAERLQSTADAVLAHIADGIVVMDAQGVVRSCNPAAERLLTRSAADAVGARCETVLGLRVGQRELDCRAGCALLAGGITDVEDVWRQDGGRRQPLLVAGQALLDEDGRVVEVVHSVRDITRLKEAEEAKTLFLATASHELKTPLTVIRGFVELLGDDIDSDARRLALAAVHRRTLELGAIIDRLLLSSRIEAGRVELTLGPVDVREVVEERVLALASTMGQPISLDVAEDLPVVVGDAAALATVVDHLVDNAVKYSAPGSPVRVGVTRDDGVVTVVVRDEGIGMGPEELAHCFDKFWQAESSDVRRYGGTGIGLYIVRSLVEAMGGRVGASSRPGVGTEVRVELAVAGEEPVGEEEHRGESTMIREFMRQLGVPGGQP